MNAIRVPRDLYAYGWFLRLEQQVGRGPASYLVHDLFYKLAYEAEDLGAAGFISRQSLLEWLTMLDVTQNLYHRINADLTIYGLLEERDNGERFFCPLFSRFNHDSPWLFQGLDASARRALFSKALAGADEVSVKKLVAGMAMQPNYWKDMNGRQVTPTELESSLVTIRMVDGITGQKARKSTEDYGEGLVQLVHERVHRYGKDLVYAVLREYMVRRHEPEVPQTTQDIFTEFDKLQLKLMPEGGWIRV